VNREKRTAIYSRLRELDPHPTTELDYGTAFELLISVILSAQATDVGVNKATARLYKVANTPQAILDLGTAARFRERARHWKGSPASAARQPTLFSIRRSANPRSPSTRISFVLPTGPGSPKARPRWKSRNAWSN
jgi:hypothetical protein